MISSGDSIISTNTVYIQQLLSNKNLLFTRKHESVWKYQMELLSWNCHYQLGDTVFDFETSSFTWKYRSLLKTNVLGWKHLNKLEIIIVLMILMFPSL